ncbi:MAG: hypothetical protein R2834_09695 [Rhodothermales bacterium]
MLVPRFWRMIVLLLLFFTPAAGLFAQSTTYRVALEPESFTLSVGDSIQVRATLIGPDGQAVADASVRVFSQNRSAVFVDRDGMLTAYKAGEHTLLARSVTPAGDRIVASFPIRIAPPPLARIAFDGLGNAVYAGTRQPFTATAFDLNGDPQNAPFEFTSSDPSVAYVDAAGMLVAAKPGRMTLIAEAGEVRGEHAITVRPNPTTAIRIDSERGQARTGDVVRFSAYAVDVSGRALEDAPIQFALQAMPADDLGPGATGQIDQEGYFVAEQPGLYTIVASSGKHAEVASIMIHPREVAGEIEFVGQGLVGNVHTSDLWVWEGVDGRDYAVTGTWGGNGEAYFWDVTDPASPVGIDTVTVDARTVNDVKVSEDGRVCVITREGASNRRNGLVILDCSNPHDVRILSQFDDELTGGVHNTFIYRDHIFAVNNGRRYDIINIEDPANPRRVGRFELDTPWRAVHDVWVVDGIAYSSNWADGVVMVDVGNGIAGGTPAHPVQIASYAYPSGWNHAAFPYRSTSTGKFYIVAGDESFPDGLSVTGKPSRAAGWIHFIDFTDPRQPKEVARYQVPEAGTHNFWIQGDSLYVAYYNGGLRVVDISGELRGDLYRQGREIARFVPADPNGYIPNAPFTWGPQPHKGNIFISDWNSGMWVVRVKKDEKKPDL